MSCLSSFTAFGFPVSAFLASCLVSNRHRHLDRQSTCRRETFAEVAKGSRGVPEVSSSLRMLWRERVARGSSRGTIPRQPGTRTRPGEPDDALRVKEERVNCHLFVGHLGNYSRWNPLARIDAMLWAAKLSGWFADQIRKLTETR